jgi:large subunit ribosomal protein L24
MNIKKGDTIQVRTGKDRSKTGKVLRVLETGRVLVEGINVVKKHTRPKRQGEKGEIVSIPKSIAVSNVGLYCHTCKRATRVGIRVDKNSKIRYCVRCENSL